jgi:predicted DCC family thiol-disulfide oxidoreductase YuxK
MKNGWTGGQYSIFRVVLATYLLGHFLARIPWRAESFSAPNGLPQAAVIGLSAVAVVLCVFLGIGLYDRAAALSLCCLWICLEGRDPLRANLSIFVAGWLLLAHAFLPPAPYGSWMARGRVDPGGGWRMPPAIFAAAWIVLALGYSYGGYSKLLNPSWRETLISLPAWILQIGTWIVLISELSFAPLTLVRRLRPWLWGVMLLIHLPLLALLNFADLIPGLVLLHLFSFDPGWIRPAGTKTERIFYDGHCGLCQRSVRLILAEDRTGTAFRFAPLQGETFAALVSAKERAALPLSLVVQTEQGALLTRSAGVLHIQRRLGGVWRLLAGLLVLLPVRLRDRLYDGVARIRHRIFARPAEVCPLMPPALRTRFDP